MVMMMTFLLITTMTMMMIKGTSSEQHSVTLEVSAEVGRCRTLLGKLGVWYQVDIGWIFQKYYRDIREIFQRSGILSVLPT